MASLPAWSSAAAPESGSAFGFGSVMPNRNVSAPSPRDLRQPELKPKSSSVRVRDDPTLSFRFPATMPESGCRSWPHFDDKAGRKRRVRSGAVRLQKREDFRLTDINKQAYLPRPRSAGWPVSAVDLCSGADNRSRRELQASRGLRRSQIRRSGVHKYRFFSTSADTAEPCRPGFNLCLVQRSGRTRATLLLATQNPGSFNRKVPGRPVSTLAAHARRPAVAPGSRFSDTSA
jgi:hypothetical protein